VLVLYGWCLVLSGLALAMRFRATVAIVVLGIASLAATASMARLLLRYRASDAPGGEGDRPASGRGGPTRGGAVGTLELPAGRRPSHRRGNRHARRSGGASGR
jgi:hypothetical protein